jgi:serine/threonine protein phosphatase PrpC
VEFVQHAMPFHMAQELDTMEGDEETRKLKVLRAFLMTDIYARKVGILSSGAAVAVALVQRTPTVPNCIRIIAANVGDSRIVAGIQTVDDHGSQRVYTERLTFDHAVTEPSEVRI